MKYLLIPLLLFYFSSFASNLNYYKVVNYTPEDFGVDMESQVLCITQNQEGNILCGTGGGVLEYNGVDWRLHRIEGTWVTSIFADANSYYIGGNSEFGYFMQNENGSFTYHSLSDFLDQTDKPKTPIWKIIKTRDDEIIFHTENALYVYKAYALKEIILPETSFHQVFYTDGNLYCRQRNVGLMHYRNGKFELLENGDFFKDKGVFGIISGKSITNDYIITNESGIFSFNKEGEFKRIVNNELYTSSLYGGILLQDSSIMLYSKQNGLTHFDPLTKKMQRITEKHGLSNIEINMIVQDDYGNIWCAGNYGVYKIRYNLPYSVFSNENGLKGKVAKTIMYENRLFVGTSRGLYQFIEKEQAFEKIEQFNKQIWDLEVFKNKLFIATDEGIFQLNSSRQHAAVNKVIYALSISDDGKHLLAAGSNVVYAYQNHSWKKLNVALTGELIELCYWERAKKANHFFAGSLKNGLYKIAINDANEIKINHYTMNNGLPNEWIIPYTLDTSLIVASKNGLFRYCSSDEIVAELPDSLKNLSSSIQAYFEPVHVYENTILYPVTAFYDAKDKVWLSNGYSLFYIDKATNKPIDTPFKEIKMGKLSSIAEFNNYCIVGSDYGIIAIDLTESFQMDSNFPVKIDRIYSISDSTVLHTDKDITLPYEKNAIAFDFSAPYYNEEKSIKYAYKLTGYDDNWTEWKSNNNIQFHQLREGAYTLYVKAKNIYGTESATKHFHFTIQPPLYRTIYAYIIYGILLIVLVYLLIQLNIRRLKIKNQKLEAIIAERTKEIRQQKDKIEKQKQEITQSIHYASRIQSAILPSQTILEETISDHFILYLPRDIVSGDFYWAGKIDNKVIILAADCTGHGVPGAFMSMLGVAFLNEIVNKSQITTASNILNELRKHVKETLGQTGKEGEAKDGMDIALCVIDYEAMKMQFAGAYNPLYYFRHGEFNEIKADKMPIGIHVKEKESFSNHELNIVQGDVYYVFSDGFVDQFGGEKGGKFKSKPFKALLSQLVELPMDKQKERLEEEFIRWRGDYEQIDDVTIIGIKI